MSNKHEVIGRAMVDQAFRESLFNDAKVACEAVNLPLQDHEYAQIRTFDRDAFEGAISAMNADSNVAG